MLYHNISRKMLKKNNFSGQKYQDPAFTAIFIGISI